MNNYQSFAVTACGSSHIKHDKECQDHSRFHPPCNLESKVITAAVADGHGDGNCFRSKKGAEFASFCGIKGVHDFIEDYEAKFGKENKEWDKDKAVKDLIKHIVAQWQIKVEKHHTKSPFDENELAVANEKYRKKYENGEFLNRAYGTTLIAAAISEHCWLGIHIGDGRFTVLYENGEFDQPVPWDDKCFLNATTSICDDDAAERARYCFFPITPEKPPPVAVFLCSDGVDDNYPVEENEKHLYKLYRTIALAFAEEGFESTCKQLKDLANKFATEGKGDDTSIAGFVDMEKVKEVVRKWKENERGTLC